MRARDNNVILEILNLTLVISIPLANEAVLLILEVGIMKSDCYVVYRLDYLYHPLVGQTYRMGVLQPICYVKNCSYYPG